MHSGDMAQFVLLIGNGQCGTTQSQVLDLQADATNSTVVSTHTS